jgi:putative restriction endonuclease
MNNIHLHREAYEKINYVLKAQSKSNYWFGVSKNKLDDYILKYGEDFNLILYGNETVEADYYVIPYISLKDILVSENLYFENERNRWVGDVKNHILKLRKSKTERNISQYYSLPTSPLAPNLFSLSLDEINDYSIENAKREISIRLRQSKFRMQVLRNFDFKCCLSQLAEQDLLVASHIIPWSEKVNTRLNPSNGFCFSILYDKLFDKGYFTVDTTLKVLVTGRLNSLSDTLKKYLLEISNQTLNSPLNFPISTDALEFHRENVFDKYLGDLQI